MVLFYYIERCYPKYAPNMHCHCKNCSKCKKKYKRCHTANNMCPPGQCCCCRKCNWNKACEFPMFMDLVYKLEVHTAKLLVFSYKQSSNSVSVSLHLHFFTIISPNLYKYLKNFVPVIPKLFYITIVNK